MPCDKKTGAFVFAVSGVKNSGKTTLLTNIIPRLRREGLRVAVIKHDAHDFESDVPGTDSRRIFDAGADAVAIYSPQKYIIAARETIAPEELIARFHDADIILFEGGKDSLYRKIEIVRRAVSEASVCVPSTLAALYTDADCEIPGIPKIPLGDYDAVTECILAELKLYR